MVAEKWRARTFRRLRMSLTSTKVSMRRMTSSGRAHIAARRDEDDIGGEMDVEKGRAGNARG